MGKYVVYLILKTLKIQWWFKRMGIFSWLVFNLHIEFLCGYEVSLMPQWMNDFLLNLYRPVFLFHKYNLSKLSCIGMHFLHLAMFSRNILSKICVFRVMLNGSSIYEDKGFLIKFKNNEWYGLCWSFFYPSYNVINKM